MAGQHVQLRVPFRSIVDAVETLELKDKQRLLKRLTRLIREEEAEEAWENSPEVLAEVAQARAEIEAGDYVTIDELDDDFNIISK